MSFDGFQNIYAQPQQPPTMPPSQFSSQNAQQQPPQGNWQSQAFNDAFYASQRPDAQHQQAHHPRHGQMSAYNSLSQPQSVEQRMYAASQMQAQANAQYYRQSMSNGVQQQPTQARPPPPRNELESALGISPYVSCHLCRTFADYALALHHNRPSPHRLKRNHHYILPRCFPLSLLPRPTTFSPCRSGISSSSFPS